MPRSGGEAVDGSVHSGGSPSQDRDLKDPDQAFRFLQGTNATHHGEGESADALAALRRKVDWNIVPVMFCCYTMQFIDKVLINVSVPTNPSASSKTLGALTHGSSTLQ